MTTETEIARCPFCFDSLVAEGDGWECKNHNLTFPRCPECRGVLVLQQAKPPIYWCAPGRVWFDGELKQISGAAHLE